MEQNKLACPKACPGCALIHYPYDETLGIKQNYILKFLAPWQKSMANIENLNFSITHAYRNKTSLSARYNGQEWFFGMMRKDELIPIHQCPIHIAKLNQSIAFLISKLPPFELFPLVNFTQVDNQIVFVLKTRYTPDMSWFWACVDEIKKLGWEAVWLHLNPVAGKKVFHKYKWELIYGEKYSKNTKGYYTARAFQQLIPELYNHALQQIISFLNVKVNDKIVDLYCGTGLSIKQWRRLGANVIGIELSGDAVECATKNNPGALILQGTCVQRLPQINHWLSENEKESFYVFANPPRSGLELEIVNWLLQTQPLKIAYLSCSPATLQRDLKLLEEQYEIKKIIPYDFFPFTRHVECLVLAEKRMPHYS